MVDLKEYTKQQIVNYITQETMSVFKLSITTQYISMFYGMYQIF